MLELLPAAFPPWASTFLTIEPGYRCVNADIHVGTMLRVDTRSTQSDRPQVVSNSRRPGAQPRSSSITGARHYTQLTSKEFGLIPMNNQSVIVA